MKSLEIVNKHIEDMKRQLALIEEDSKNGIEWYHLDPLYREIECMNIIKQDLEDYSIIREIENNVRDGKKVVLNDKKYYVCEFILAEHSTVRHLTILYGNYKKILRLEDYKKFWKFED